MVRVADDALIRTDHAEFVGHLGQPGGGEFRARRSLKVLKQRQHFVALVGPGRHDRRRALRAQRLGRGGERGLAVQVHQVLGPELPIRSGGGTKTGDGVVVHDTLQRAIALG